MKSTFNDIEKYNDFRFTSVTNKHCPFPEWMRNKPIPPQTNSEAFLVSGAARAG